MRITEDKAKLVEKIKNHFLWYHSFDLGNGEKVTGITKENKFSSYPIPKSLEGWSVLDIAGWDGAMSFECEKRGAERVVLSNLKNIAQMDYALSGKGSWETYKKNLSYPWSNFLEDGSWSKGAELIKQLYNSEIEIVESTVYELEEKLNSSFDLVLCCGLLYHLRDPIRALQICRRLAKKQIIVESMCISKRRSKMYTLLRDLLGKPKKPIVEYLPQQGKGGSDWWSFSVEALKSMMEDADFKNVEIKEHNGGRCILVGYV